MNTNVRFEIGKLEAQVENLTQVIVDLRTALDRIGRRLEFLEKENYLWRGGLSVILTSGVVVGTLASFALHWMK